jgi:hypothetical protein
MKLLRWAVAGASVYAVYKYSIGRKARGEDVFVSPDKEVAKLGQDEPEPAAPPPAKPKAKSKTATKPRSKKAPAKKIAAPKKT